MGGSTLGLQTPAPDAPAEGWGRLAVSIPGWPTKYKQPSGQLVDDHGIEWVYSDQADWDNGGSGKPVPNPDHDGTAGCLLALLSADDRPVSATRMTPLAVSVWRHGLGTHTAPTLGRACIAAAAALGRWPGGEG